MSFAYLPFYTGDYLRDTRGLSMAGHGCFVLLLCFCWDNQGPLPLDMEEIATICGARNQEERLTLERILSRYFVQMADGYYNRRMQMEVERACSISIKRKSAGAKGFQAKAKHLPSKSQASAKQVPLLNPNLIPALEVGSVSASVGTVLAEGSVGALVGEGLGEPSTFALAALAPLAPKQPKQAAKATRLPADWELPDAWRDWAVTAHKLDPQRVIRISLVFRDHWHAKAGKDACKLSWLATWRNWIRREVGDA